MEYFGVSTIPKGFLRARFKTATNNQTEQLGILAAPLLSALLNRASSYNKLRVGFKGFGYSGKTTLSTAMLQASFIYKHVKSLYYTSSFAAEGLTGEKLLHFDARAISYCDYEDFLSAHKRGYEEAVGHLIEWPEDDENPSLNMLWDIDNTDLTKAPYLENTPRQIDFFCTDEITLMPEYKEFIKNADEAGLLVEEFSPKNSP